MRILAIEPYATRSHLQFLEGLRAHSRHQIALDTLAPRKWKWRMRTSGLHFAPRVAASGPWDLLLCSDFTDLAALRALLPAGQRDLPAVLYFHENQLTYPLPDYEERDYQFTLIHLHGMLAADHVLFNSSYHRRTFLEALPEALRVFPDFDGPALVEPLAERSSVLHLGSDVPAGAPSEPVAAPRIAWNHRWEHDKDPDAFAEVLDVLAATGRRFRVRLFGERFHDVPRALGRIRERHAARLDAAEFVADRGRYLAELATADVVLSTARHEFFGLGALEGIRSGLFPVLPADLAYPELLSEECRAWPYLYTREEGVLGALEAALDGVASGARMNERQRLIEYTDCFTWQRLAPEYDRLFERVCEGS